MKKELLQAKIRTLELADSSAQAVCDILTEMVSLLPDENDKPEMGFGKKEKPDGPTDTPD